MTEADQIASLTDRVGLLEQQVALFSAITAQLLSGRWTGADTEGELPHAAAELVALLGGQDAADSIGFQPVPFRAG